MNSLFLFAKYAPSGPFLRRDIHPASPLSASPAMRLVTCLWRHKVLAAVVSAAFLCAILSADAQPAQLQITGGASSNINVQWNTGGSLQSAPSTTGPWTTTTNGVNVSSVFATTATGQAQFYRVVANGVAGQPVSVLPTSVSQAPLLETATIQLLSAPVLQGNTRLGVIFQSGQISSSNTLTLLVGNQLTTLRDDGVFPDLVAGDGIFSAAINVNTNDLNGINLAINALLPSQRITEIFDDNRNLLSTNSLPTFPLSNFLAGAAVPIFTNLEPRDEPLCAGSPTAYDYHKTILITDPSVVQDSMRTWDPANPSQGTKMGAWTFGKLMTEMANTPVSGIQPSDFVLNWLRTWQFSATINFDTVPAESLFAQQVTQPWLAASLKEGLPANTLDLSIAPFRLLAIVNRIDLHGNTSYGAPAAPDGCITPALGGEGRFVFEVTDTNGNLIHGTNTTVILEYGIPSNTCPELQNWAQQWANLNSLPFGGSPNNYNIALQAITDQFTAAGTNPARPNQSAINHVRANDFLSGTVWIMRQWALSCDSASLGQLEQTTVNNTPAPSVDNTQLLEDFITANATPLCSSTTVNPVSLPLTFEGQPFLGASATMTNPAFFWTAPGLTSAQYCGRHGLSLNTCSGCHSGETQTTFLQIEQNGALPAIPSAFLTGETVNDPVASGTSYHFADLSRRVEELNRLVICPCVFQIPFRPLHFDH
jgi:hypothetical protein